MIRVSTKHWPSAGPRYWPPLKSMGKWKLKEPRTISGTWFKFINKFSLPETSKMADALQISGKLNLWMNLIRVPLIVLGFFNFHFPIDFIGGQLTGGQCFVETQLILNSCFCWSARVFLFKWSMMWMGFCRHKINNLDTQCPFQHQRHKFDCMTSLPGTELFTSSKSRRLLAVRKTQVSSEWTHLFHNPSIFNALSVCWLYIMSLYRRDR